MCAAEVFAIEYRFFDERKDSTEQLTRLLHDAYARLGDMGLNYTAVDQSVEVTRRRMAEGQCMVAVARGVVIGTLVLTGPIADCVCTEFTRPEVASVHQFAVDPKHQGAGIGRELLLRAEGLARERGFVHLGLDTAEQATHLRALYQRLGYADVGHVQWPGKVYRSVVMFKRLNTEAAE